MQRRAASLKGGPRLRSHEVVSLIKVSPKTACQAYYRLALPARELNHLMTRYLNQELFHNERFEDDRRRLARLGPCVEP